MFQTCDRIQIYDKNHREILYVSKKSWAITYIPDKTINNPKLRSRGSKKCGLTLTRHDVALNTFEYMPFESDCASIVTISISTLLSGRRLSPQVEREYCFTTTLDNWNPWSRNKKLAGAVMTSLRNAIYEPLLWPRNGVIIRRHGRHVKQRKNEQACYKTS